MTTPMSRTHTRTVAATALLLGAGVVVGALGVPSLAVAATSTATATIPRAEAPAAPLVGTWIGTYEGYYDGRLETGQQKIVVTKASGYSAKGTWQFRESGKKPWSAPKPVQFTVLPETGESDVDVYGADTAGTYAGELQGNRLNLTYSEAASKPQTMVFQLRRR